VAIVSALALRPLCSGAGLLGTWTSRNPLPTGNNLNAITFGMVIAGNTNFVAVGDAGTVLTSANGSNWVTRVSGTNAVLLGIAYGIDAQKQPRLVAVGSDPLTRGGVILTSPDGFNWGSQSPGSAPSLNAVVQGADASGAPLLVAVGDKGWVSVSSDGTNWTAKTPVTANTLRSLAFGNVGGHNTFVAVGDVGTTVTSIDGGANWATNAYISPDIFYAVIFAQSGFVLVGSWSGAVGNPSATFTSADGLLWRPRPANTTNSLTGLAVGNGELVAVGLSGTTSTSPDAKTWTVNISAVFGINLHGVAFGNNTLVAVGDGGANFTSFDGTTWAIDRFRAVVSPLTGVTYGNNGFVVVGGKPNAFGVVLTSADGLFWTHQLSVSNVFLSGITFGTNAAGTELFVAVGNAVANNAATILTSRDGTNWTAHPAGMTTLTAVTCSGTSSGPLFEVVGNNGIALSSPDGTNWASHSTAVFATMNSVRYGNGRFVAVGLNGTAQASVDGTNWVAASPLPVTLNGVTYANGRFFGAGTGGGDAEIRSSADGTNWTLSASIPSQPLNAIAYGDGRFVAVGQSLNGGSAVIMVSAEGTNWVTRHSGTEDNLAAVAFGAGRTHQFIAVGAADTILGWTVSVPLPLFYSQGGAQITVSDMPFGRVLIFEVSRDLVQWSPLTNVVVGRLAPTTLVVDPSAINFPQGFYSLRIR
jgi:hypothetical protein